MKKGVYTPIYEQAQHQVVTRLGQEQWHALLAELQATVTLVHSFQCFLW